MKRTRQFVYSTAVMLIAVILAVPDAQAQFKRRGPPISNVKQQLDLTDFVPAPFFCENFDVIVSVVGHDRTRVWVSGEEMLIAFNTNVDVTATNPATGASVTNNQTNNGEILVVNGVFTEFRDRGSLTHIVIPGEGLIALFAGNVETTIDTSVYPPVVTTVFRGRESGAVDFCDLISP